MNVLPSGCQAEEAEDTELTQEDIELSVFKALNEDEAKRFVEKERFIKILCSTNKNFHYSGAKRHVLIKFKLEENARKASRFVVKHFLFDH
jgi:hypothetical protein